MFIVCMCSQIHVHCMFENTVSLGTQASLTQTDACISFMLRELAWSLVKSPTILVKGSSIEVLLTAVIF